MIRVSRGSQQIRTLDSNVKSLREHLNAADERFKQQVLAEQLPETRHPLLRTLREAEIRNAEQAAERLQKWHRDKQLPKPERAVSTVTGRTRPALVDRETYERTVFYKLNENFLWIDTPRKTLPPKRWDGTPDAPKTYKDPALSTVIVGPGFWMYSPFPSVKMEPLPESLFWRYTQALEYDEALDVVHVYRPDVELSWKCVHGHDDYTDDRGLPYCTGCQVARLKLPLRPRLFRDYAGTILKVVKERGFRASIPEFREDLIAAVEAHLWEIREEIETIEVLRGQRFAGVCVKKKVEQYLEQIQARGKGIYTPGRWPSGGGRHVIQGTDGKELPWSQLMVGPDGKLAEQDGSGRHTKALGTWDEANAEFEGEKAGEIATSDDPVTEIIVTDEAHPRNDFAGLVNPAAFTRPTTSADVVKILAKLPAVHRQVVMSRHGESDSGHTRTWAEVELHTGLPERTARRYYDDARRHMCELAGWNKWPT